MKGEGKKPGGCPDFYFFALHFPLFAPHRSLFFAFSPACRSADGLWVATGHCAPGFRLCLLRPPRAHARSRGNRCRAISSCRNRTRCCRDYGPGSAPSVRAGAHLGTRDRIPRHCMAFIEYALAIRCFPPATRPTRLGEHAVEPHQIGIGSFCHAWQIFDVTDRNDSMLLMAHCATGSIRPQFDSSMVFRLSSPARYAPSIKPMTSSSFILPSELFRKELRHWITV